MTEFNGFKGAAVRLDDIDISLVGSEIGVAKTAPVGSGYIGRSVVGWRYACGSLLCRSQIV